MKVFLHYQDNPNTEFHKTLKITLPKSWKTGPVSRILDQFVESYNSSPAIRDSSHELSSSDLHLAINSSASNSSSNDPSSSSPTPLASDAIVIDALSDRIDIYVLHGPALTTAQISEQRRIADEKKQSLAANLVSCTHFGCQKRFPRGGPFPKCQYHMSPPVFHETAKFWSCCPQKKAYDWDDFQNIPGCRMGVCTDQKDEELGKQFLGGCDLREEAQGGVQLKSIDDFNKAVKGGSAAAPVLERLKGVLGEMGVEDELFHQVVEGMKKELQEGGQEGDHVEAVVKQLGQELKKAMKAIAAEQLRIK